jgi:hypothetical protein
MAANNTVFCTACHAFAMPCYNSLQEYSWCHAWTCDNTYCAKKKGVFFSCKECVHGTNAMKRNSAHKHNKKFHQLDKRPSKQVKVSETPAVEASNNAGMFSNDDDMEEEESHSQDEDNPVLLLFDASSHLRESLEGYFERKESAVFYEHERKAAGSGYRSIVAGALYRDSADHKATLLREVDVDLHLDISILLDVLPSTQHERLFNVLHSAEDNGKLLA